MFVISYLNQNMVRAVVCLLPYGLHEVLFVTLQYIKHLFAVFCRSKTSQFLILLLLYYNYYI